MGNDAVSEQLWRLNSEGRHEAVLRTGTSGIIRQFISERLSSQVMADRREAASLVNALANSALMMTDVAMYSDLLRAVDQAPTDCQEKDATLLHLRAMATSYLEGTECEQGAERPWSVSDLLDTLTSPRET